LANSAPNSSKGATKVSGTYLPPYAPKCPEASGTGRYSVFAFTRELYLKTAPEETLLLK
jgi:hypothetical protein